MNEYATSTDEQATSPSESTASPARSFCLDEWRGLYALRARYRQGQDHLSTNELARLEFVRWLHRSGRLVA